MRSGGHKKKPSFLWQAVLILLPVMVLTVVGLFSLRQDRLLAEQDAKAQAAAIARRLTQAVSDETVWRELLDYSAANFDLNYGRWPFDTPAWMDTAAYSLFTSWQKANPGIDLSAQPFSQCAVNLQGELCSPTPYLASPQPPNWVRQLSPAQARLWQEEQQIEFTIGNPAPALKAITNFLNTLPPDEAMANAEYHRLLLITRKLPPAEAVKRLAESNWSKSWQLSEAGLPVGQLICYRALRLLPDHSGVPPNLMDSIVWMIRNVPSILSPRLIAEAERVTKPPLTNSNQKIAAMRTWWNANERARQVFADFRAQYPAANATNGLFWVTSSGSKFLLLPNGGTTISSTTGTTSMTTTNPGILIFPEAIISQALNGAAARADISVPAYALVELEIGGKELDLRQNHLVTTTNAMPATVLAEATGMLPRFFAFRVRVFLNDRNALYARQHQRTLWFGALILASSLAVLAGLLAAHRAFGRQQELNDLKSNFVSSVSHELRAPIASVRLMAENLETGKIPEAHRQQEYFSFIVQECRRLSSLIENVLDFSRIEQGRKQYEFEPTNLVALTQTTVRLMEPYALEKGVILRLETSGPTDSAPHFEACVDGRALQQALVNLLDNAIKHSAKGETVVAGITAAKAGGTPVIQLFVADRGPGIPAAEQKKIFERFYRLGSELRRETQGIGIGLSIVKHIVEAHGGRIIVHSKPGHGSRFTIEIPTGRSHE